MAIHVVETCVVKPVTPTKRHALALGGLDLYWSAYGYARTVLFYRTQQDQLASIIRSLKRSLSAVLVDFYPVAGQLVEDPAADGRLTLDCNDAGVEFIEAYCSHISFAQLEAMHFAVQDFFRALTRTKNRVGKQDPIMSVQVTSFPGGGVAIGASCDHTLFDGFSFVSFMNCWAECFNEVPALSNPPCHIRKVVSLVDADNLPNINVSTTATHPLDSLQGARPVEKEAVQTRIVAVPADMVEKLKSQANFDAELGGGDMRFTSFEVLAAYLWKARTKANTQQSEDDEVALRFRINARPRLAPKLPATYFGPAVIFAQVGAMKAGELRRESLATTAGRIHEAIGVYTQQDKLRQEIERYEVERYEATRVFYHGAVDEGKQKKLDKVPVVVTEISDIRRVGFYNAQFHFGELRAVCPATSRDAGVFSLVPDPAPSREAGSGQGLTFILNLATTEMEALLPCLLSHIST